MWYTYLLECSDKTFYTGITTNLQKRLETHNSSKGAKYTRGRTPVKLLCAKEFPNKSEASKEEYRIKKLSKQKKQFLVGAEGFEPPAFWV